VAAVTENSDLRHDLQVTQMPSLICPLVPAHFYENSAIFSSVIGTGAEFSLKTVTSAVAMKSGKEYTKGR
jgi:hypothetical protein